MAKIEHLVVLMLENCSFDRMLGFSRAASPAFAGLVGDEANPVGIGQPSFAARLRVSHLPYADYDGYVTDPDPHHEVPDVTRQLYGNGVPGTDPVTNEGFVDSYRTLDTSKGAHVMGCFDPGQLAAVTALASEFVVFDHWHASVPGPTWPNRFFAHCATSGGLWESPSDAASAASELGNTFPMESIFDSLYNAGTPWAVYYHDVPQSLALARLHGHRDRFKHIGAFLDAARSGQLPAYSFIEPAFFNLPSLGIYANDMHPAHDVRHGDKLIADAYNALRAGPLWPTTALLVLWDEHGGFYDHVAPPTAADGAVADSPDAASRAASFKFDRLGVRVPAILASPWVPRGGVVSDLFENSAIPATVKALFGLPNFLSSRDAASATFDKALSLDVLRDTVASIPYTAPAGQPLETVVAAMSGTQRSLVALSSGLQVQGLATGPAANSIAGSVMRVARYLDV